MLAVMLQHNQFVATSITGVDGGDSNIGSIIVDAGEDDDGDGGRVKVLTNIWDNEW